MASPLFHRGHYNIIAAQIKKHYMTHGSINLASYRLANRTLEELALSIAQRLKEDNPEFDPIKFLDQCSPDPDRFPFSELWEDE